MKKITLLFLTSLFLFSCSKDDETMDEIGTDPQNEEETEIENDSIAYFTFKSSAAFAEELEGGVNHIVINDLDGNLIDYKKIEAGLDLVFKAQKDEAPEIFTVTSAYYIDDSEYNEEYAGFSTYHHIKSGTEWDFSFYMPYEEAEAIGTFNLIITDASEARQGEVMSAYHGHSFSNNENDSFEMNDITLYENQTPLLILEMSSGVKKYLFIDKVSPGETLEISTAQLEEYESKIALTVPDEQLNDYHATVYGARNGQEYRIGNSSKYNNPLVGNSTEISVVANLERYQTTFSISDWENGYFIDFSKYSNTPENVDVPVFTTDFEVLNDQMDSFDFSTSIKYDRMRSNWRFSKALDNGKELYVSWSVHSNDQKFATKPELPEEIFQLITDFNEENLEYDSTRLVRGGYSYEQEIYADFDESDSDLNGEVLSMFFINRGNKSLTKSNPKKEKFNPFFRK